MKKIAILLIGLLFFIILISSLMLHFIRLDALSLTARVVLLVLFNLNIIALLTLIFFVTKSLVKLYLERRQKVLGSKFKTKIVVIFVIITSIPTALMFFAASGLVTNYIDRWFTPQFRQPIDSTLNIAKAIYEIRREKTLEAARSIILKGSMPMEYKVYRQPRLQGNSSEVIREAFEGREGTEVISGAEGDTVRAVVPDISGGKLAGVVIVESHIPKDITLNIEKIKTAYENFLNLEALKQPLRLNYLLLLGFFTLMVFFMALWVSLRIARGITEPIQTLAQATREVASGNLDTNVGITRDDEIGFLISSFNFMVKELKEGKDSLQKTYAESDRRRLYMENILGNIQSGVISLDSEGCITTINSAACTILNISPKEVIGKNFKPMLSRIGSDSLHELIYGINLKTLQRVEKEVWATISGRRTMLKVSIMGLRDKSFDYLGLLVVFDDLTDLIKAQRSLAWQEVAKRIAHEIKNPLTPIKLSTERMLKKWERKDADFDAVFERSTKTIIREVDSLKRLVDEFSRFGKMPKISKSPTAIASIIDEVVNLYRDFKGFNISLSLPQDIPLIDMDGEQFKRVLINLFDNAIQAMSGGGNIGIGVAFDIDVNSVNINVADDGPGIKDEDKEKLFLPYFSTKDSGTGLGLAIASSIIAEHRGYLRVKDNEPHGTVFTIELPVKGG